MLINHFDSLVFLIGLVAVAYPLWAAWYFRKTTKLGKASSWMYLSEAFSMGMTCAFAYMAIHDLMHNVSESEQMLMRLAMFLFAIFSSHYLYRVIRKITRQEHANKPE